MDVPRRLRHGDTIGELAGLGWAATSITVALVDDDPAFSENLAALLERRGDIRCLGKYATAAEALLIRRSPPRSASARCTLISGASTKNSMFDAVRKRSPSTCSLKMGAKPIAGFV
jgi:DNA-binding NarL/FixJ family response regulator